MIPFPFFLWFLFCSMSHMLLVEWSFSMVSFLCCMVTKLAHFMWSRHYLRWFICVQLLFPLEEIFTSWWNYISYFLWVDLLDRLDIPNCSNWIWPVVVDVDLFLWSDLILLMQKVKTGVVRNTCNPEWNDELTISITNPNIPILLVRNPFPLIDRINSTGC